MLPRKLQTHIETQLDAEILSAQSVSGGSINQAAKIEVENIGTCFLKWNTSANSDMFEKEAAGLKLLEDAETNLIIPEVILTGQTEDGTGYLLLNFLETEPAGNPSAHNFGAELAKLHKHTAKQFGLGHDNYIGRLHQSNTQHSNWIDFFIQERIEPQLNMALDSGYFSSGIHQAFQKLFKELPNIFPEEPPSLLHGDLWSGNYFCTQQEQTAIFDPAVYYGHREIELAFTYLFGGFSAGFYDAYNESYPLKPGFKTRKNLYNLYPLLVHTNLFGRSYAQQVEEIIKGFRSL